ncbi:hypothetical protein Hdeb2414_s0019g00545391 [Helianthus debilis subsp. tardiflorus]
MDYNISRVCGSIRELLECDEKLFTVVEVTAGNRHARALDSHLYLLAYIIS